MSCPKAHRSAIAAFFTIFSSGCSAEAAVDKLCPYGRLGINANGSITDEKFGPTTAEDERDGVRRMADALSSGRPYSISLIVEKASRSGSEYNVFEIIARPQSTIRHMLSGNKEHFVSAFQIPETVMVPDEAEQGDKLPSASMVSGIITSNGRLVTEGSWPVTLVSATWCVG